MAVLRELGLPGGGEARVDDAVHVLRELGLPGAGDVGDDLNSSISIAGKLSGSFLKCQTEEVGDLVLSKKSLVPILTLVFKPSSFLML